MEEYPMLAYWAIKASKKAWFEGTRAAHTAARIAHSLAQEQFLHDCPEAKNYENRIVAYHKANIEEHYSAERE